MRHWIERFDARLDDAIAVVGKRRARVWRLYLRASRNGFVTGNCSIFQILATRDRALPAHPRPALPALAVAELLAAGERAAAAEHTPTGTAPRLLSEQDDPGDRGAHHPTPSTSTHRPDFASSDARSARRDHVEARSRRAPRLQRVVSYLSQIDAPVVVWKLDRLGRSLHHLLDTVRALDSSQTARRSPVPSTDPCRPCRRWALSQHWCPGRRRDAADFGRALSRVRSRSSLGRAFAAGVRTVALAHVPVEPGNRLCALGRLAHRRNHAVDELGLLLELSRRQLGDLTPGPRAPRAQPALPGNAVASCRHPPARDRRPRRSRFRARAAATD